LLTYQYALQLKRLHLLLLRLKVKQPLLLLKAKLLQLLRLKVKQRASKPD
jgi:hypothetical protein